MIRSLATLVSLAGLYCLAFAGCGQSKGELSGTVTYKGEKIPQGRITFQSQVGRMESFSGQISAGDYSVKEIPSGPVKVAIETFGTTGATGKSVPKGLQIPPSGVTAATQAKKLPIPENYSNLEKSGLAFDVGSGPQTKDFELK